MTGPLARVVLFSLVIYVLAFLLTTVLHEVGHALTSYLLGGKPVLHHVFVEHEEIEGGARAIVSAAGPLVSLVQGVVLLGVLRSISAAPSALRLAIIWLCIHGLVNFFGYLITTPFVESADLGKIATYLELPMIVRWGLFGSGITAITVIGLWAREPLLAFVVDPATLVDAGARSRHMMAIGVAPWLLGGLVIGAFSWPSPHWITFVYPFFAGFFLIVSVRRSRNVIPPELPEVLWTEVSLWPWVLLVLAVVIIFRGVLLPGIRFGS